MGIPDKYILEAIRVINLPEEEQRQFYKSWDNDFYSKRREEFMDLYCKLSEIKHNDMHHPIDRQLWKLKRSLEIIKEVWEQS